MAWLAPALLVALALRAELGPRQSPDSPTNDQPVAGTSPATNQASAFELFKAFVSNPPPIADLQLSYVGPPPYVRTPDGRMVRVPAPTVYVRARQQAGSFVCLQSPGPEGLRVMPFSEGFVLSSNTVFVRWEDEFRWIDGRQNSVTMWRGHPTYPLDPDNPILLHYEADTLPLFSLLSMGPHLVPPGSIRWQENRFEYAASTRDSTFKIQGELFAGVNGFPEKMRLRYRGSTAIGEYTVRYYYGANPAIPFYLPERILSSVLHGKTEAPDKDIRLSSLRLAPATLSPGAFRPDTWLSGAHLTRFIFNGELFMETRDGRLALVRRPRSPQPPLLSQAHANRYYYVSCALATFGFLFLARRMRINETTTVIRKDTPC